MQAPRFIRRPPSSDGVCSEHHANRQRIRFNVKRQQAYKETMEKVQKTVLSTPLSMSWVFSLPNDLSNADWAKFRDKVQQRGFKTTFVPVQVYDGRNEVFEYPAQLTIKLSEEEKDSISPSEEFEFYEDFNSNHIKKLVQSEAWRQFGEINNELKFKFSNLQSDNDQIVLDITTVIPSVVEWIQADVRKLGYVVTINTSKDRDGSEAQSMSITFDKV